MARITRFPVAQRVVDILMTKRRPLRLNEATICLTVKTKPAESLHSFLGAPILSSDGVRGWVYLLNKLNAYEFSEADERLTATLVTQVAIAYENARLYTDAQRHASELQMEIAERKQAEEQRAQLLIREQSARAEAEQANRTKDEFLATLVARAAHAALSYFGLEPSGAYRKTRRTADDPRI